MNSKRDFFMEAFSNIVWLTVFYGVFIVPAVMLFNMRTDVLLPVSTAILFIFFFLRRLIRPIVPMLLMHLIIPAVVFYFAPSTYAQVLYVGVALVFMAFSLQQRYKRLDTFASGFIYIAPGLLIALALFMGHHGHDYMNITYAVLIIFTSIASKLHIRMTQVNDSLTVITQTSTQPVKKILAFDYKAMLVLSVVIVGMVVFLYVFLFRPALEAVSGIGINVQRDPSVYEEYILDFPMQATPAGGGMGLGVLYDGSGPSSVWLYLEWVFMAIMPPILILGAGFIIFRLVRDIYRRLSLKNRQTQKHADGFEDIKEFIRTPKVRRSWFFGLRGEHKLRRLFRETVTRHIKKGVPIKNTDTPVQMVEKIKAEDISNLVEEYAAVRYGKV